jgi:hypothetical protein
MMNKAGRDEADTETRSRSIEEGHFTNGFQPFQSQDFNTMQFQCQVRSMASQ